MGFDLLREDFEADWVPGELEDPRNPNSKPGHRAIRVEQQSGQAYLEYNGSHFNPPGWTSFYRHGLPVPHDAKNTVGYAAPEIRHAEASNPDRYRSGRRGQVCFTFSKVHDAGLFKRVATKKGQELELTAFAHAWSNKWGTAYTSKPGWSDGAGYDQVAIPKGDTDNGDLMNFTFYLGIDPDGGEDPFGPGVIWSKGMHIYNGFAPVGPLTVKANGDVATVFLRSVVLWASKHCDAYWEDVLLSVVKEPDPDPDPVPGHDYGSDVGIHYLTTGNVLNFQELLLQYDTRFKVVKGVSDWGAIKEIKKRDPKVITVGRVFSDKEGVGEANDPFVDTYAVAMGLMGEINLVMSGDPELRSAVDYWEVCNEPLGGGSSSESYARLARIMNQCMTIAEERDLKLGLFAFNAGTPEYVDMLAMADTGVFGKAKAGGHILTLHEGQLGEGPIDESVGEIIPGAPPVTGAGSMVFRFKYLYQILEQRDEVIPLFVSEWYPGGQRDDIRDVAGRYIWYDNQARPLPYFMGFAAFTLGAAFGWEKREQTPYYHLVMDHMVAVREEQNWGADPEPEPKRKGDPRLQYPRCYALLPPDADDAWAHAVVAASWNAHRWTVGSAADDAGIGYLDVREIVAVNPDNWGAGLDLKGLRGFFETHYPGVVVKMINALNPDDLYAKLSGRTFEDLEPLTEWPTERIDPPHKYKALMGAHFQTDIEGWLEWVKDTQPPIVVVFYAEAAIKVKAVSPNTIVLWRIWIDDEEQDRYLYMDNPVLAAREYLATFEGALLQEGMFIDYVTSLNERYTWDNDRTRRAALFDAAFAQEVYLLGMRVKAGILAGPVGYPNLAQVDLIRPAVEAACQYDAVILYHCYHMVVNGVSKLADRWLLDAGLFLDVLDPVFKSWGCEPLYLPGEIGPVGGDGTAWNMNAGWRAGSVYGGDLDKVFADMDVLNDIWNTWNYNNDDRFLGGALFTSGEGVGWDLYLYALLDLYQFTVRYYA